VPNNMAHIELSRNVDLLLIAPATADFMAKVANGFGDDLLSTLVLARNAASCPLLICPAMNREMWENPATQRNLATLKGDGVVVLGPAPGAQACGETGMGRMLEPAEIVSAVLAFQDSRSRASATPSSASNPFRGKRIMVTAGPTVEAIDPVRSITNASSGKMGYAIAAALIEIGADVTLVSGPTSLAPPAVNQLIPIRSASEMLEAVNANIGDVDAFFAVAAVADYRPARASSQKIKKTASNLTLELIPTVDILAAVAARESPPFCVGFAAESDNIVENAAKKRQNKKISMIVANHAASAIGADDNQVTIIDADGQHTLSRADKEAVARQIVDHAARLYRAKSAPENIHPLTTAKHVA